MKVGIPRESLAGERRVAATPDSVRKLVKSGFEVVVERDAGLAAGFDDASYAGAGATLADRAIAGEIPHRRKRIDLLRSRRTRHLVHADGVDAAGSEVGDERGIGGGMEIVDQSLA